MKAPLKYSIALLAAALLLPSSSGMSAPIPPRKPAGNYAPRPKPFGFSDVRSSAQRILGGLALPFRGRHSISPSGKRKASPSTKPRRQKFLARITVYWSHGAGTDRWSRRGESSTGESLKDRAHAAVDPAVIPYGSRIKLLGPKVRTGPKVLRAVDTGSAVRRRTAAIASARTKEERHSPVIDVFFKEKSEALAFANASPPFRMVEIY